MKRFLLICGLLAAGGLLFALCSGLVLGRIVSAAVNRMGPKITGTRVELQGADVSLLRCSVALDGLEVGNPEGFRAPYAATIGRVHVAFAPRSVFRGPLIIDEIALQKTHFCYETTFLSSNLNVLLNQVNKYKKSEASAPATAEAGPARKIIIRHLLIEDAEAELVIAGTSLPVPVPRIEMMDVGLAEGGISPAEAGARVLKELLTAVGRAAQQGATQDTGRLGDAAKSTGQKVKKGVKDLLDRLRRP